MSANNHSGGVAPDQQLAVLAELQQQLARYEEAMNRSQRSSFDEEEGEGIDLREIWNVIWRRRWTILLSSLVMTIVSVVYTATLTPYYQASVLVQIEGPKANVVDFKDVEVRGPDYYETQYQLLRSRAMARKVIDRLGLQFNERESSQPKTASSNVTTTIKNAIRSVFGLPSLEDNAAPTTPNNEGQLLSGLSISPVGNSRLVRIGYTSPSPALAANIANAYAEAYIALTLDQRFEASDYAQKFLKDRIEQARAELEDSELRLLDYAQERGIVDTSDKLGILKTRLQTMSTALVSVEQGLIEAEAQYEEMIKASGDSLAQALGIGLVASLKERRIDLQTEYQELSKLFKPSYPRMEELQRQIDQIDTEIELEVNAIREGIQARYQAKLTEAKRLREGIDEAQADILDLNARSTRFQALRREVDTNAQLYDGLLQRLKEVDVSAGVATNNISIVDRAQIPGAPITPNMKRNLMMALILGLIAGGGLAFLFEMLDDTIKSTADLEKITDRPVLGVTPVVSEDEGTDAEVALMSYLQPTSGLAESLRSMRTALSLSSSEGAPKVLHFTSTAAGEGKTTTAINTAINFAQTGGRVLIIDGDLRNPSLHKVFNKPNDAGLTNYLTGESDPGRVTQTTGIDNLYLMSSGPIPPNPAELLHGAKMFDLVGMATQRFDYVVIDGPPLLGLADALLLADVAKATLYVVSAHTARRGGVEAGLKRLQHSRANVLGMVLTKFDMSRSSYGYGYGYSYNYAYQYEYGAKRNPEDATG